jgi:hypothetical protein
MLKLPGQPEIGAQERRGQLRNQSLCRIGLVSEPLAEGPGRCSGCDQPVIGFAGLVLVAGRIAGGRLASSHDTYSE